MPPLTTSVMRICHYAPHRGGDDDDTDDDGASDDDVAFGEHTDTTFITCGVVADEPGLQLMVKDR